MYNQKNNKINLLVPKNLKELNNFINKGFSQQADERLLELTSLILFQNKLRDIPLY